MKKNIIFAVALTIATTFGFTSCNKSAPKMDEKSETTSQKAASTQIAYVEVDSIMTQYQFCKEYTKILNQKGTDTGVLTDLNGNFSIPVTKQGRYTLNITFVGMTALETAATTTKAIVVKMEADSKVLDEVVVSGFQTISRERNTGSAVIVNSEKLSKIQATTLSSKLEGMTPGLTNISGVNLNAPAPVLFNMLSNNVFIIMY